NIGSMGQRIITPMIAVMVSKRLGIGTTINIGTKTGKSIYYSLFVFVALLLTISAYQEAEEQMT
ncbi:hypothetical protein, partial [Paenibacillus sp.]|uniref:hypothetical protein n=1 Tax=Paenibacillus sp. TaxID=58172 RepID=UPI0028B1D6A9